MKALVLLSVTLGLAIAGHARTVRRQWLAQRAIRKGVQGIGQGRRQPQLVV